MTGIETLAPLGAQVVINALLLWFVTKGLPEQQRQARDQMEKINEGWQKTVAALDANQRDLIRAFAQYTKQIDRFMDIYVAATTTNAKDAREAFEKLRIDDDPNDELD